MSAAIYSEQGRAAFLTEAGYWLHLIRAVEQAGRRLYLQGRLPGSFYDGRGQEAYAGLKSQGILVRYFDKPGLTDKIRITIGTSQENNALIGGIKAQRAGRLSRRNGTADATKINVDGRDSVGTRVSDIEFAGVRKQHSARWGRSQYQVVAHFVSPGVYGL